MKKYRITIEVASYTVEIEAESKEKAIRKAEDSFAVLLEEEPHFYMQDPEVVEIA